MPLDALVQAPSLRRLLVVTNAQMQLLAELLIDRVDCGAAVSFVHPLPMFEALAF